MRKVLCFCLLTLLSSSNGLGQSNDSNSKLGIVWSDSLQNTMSLSNEHFHIHKHARRWLFWNR